MIRLFRFTILTVVFCTSFSSSCREFIESYRIVSDHVISYLKVIASTSDGASTNRRFVKIHRSPKSPPKSSMKSPPKSSPKSSKETVVYKTKNLYSADERDLFL